MDNSDGAVAVTVDGRSVRLTNLDKILYPATETTKGEVLHYYATVTSRLLAQLRERPVTRVRFPHGVADLKFFEKNTPGGAPSWIPRVTVENVEYPLVESTAALTYFANLASLEFHTPQWRLRKSAPQHPDRLVIDLDPGAPAGLDECARVALIMKDLFDSLQMPCVPVTSGSKGMQIYTALDGSYSSEDARILAQQLAEKLAQLQPDLVVATMTKSVRAGKVFIDWSQNTAFKTTITPWSLRGRPTPCVAAPRRWDEISDGADEPGTLEQLSMDEVLTQRLNQPDPMAVLDGGAGAG